MGSYVFTYEAKQLHCSFHRTQHPGPTNAFFLQVLHSMFILVSDPSIAENCGSQEVHRGSCKEEEASLTVKLIVLWMKREGSQIHWLTTLIL